MLQFYFLSIASNLLAAAVLGSDWILPRFASLRSIVEALCAQRPRLIIGLLAMLTGIGTLFVPAAPPLLWGDLFPSVTGVGAGIALLFEALRQEAFYRGDPATRDDPPWKAPRAYRTALSAFALAAAVLHFFLPERLFL